MIWPSLPTHHNKQNRRLCLTLGANKSHLKPATEFFYGWGRGGGMMRELLMPSIFEIILPDYTGVRFVTLRQLLLLKFD